MWSFKCERNDRNTNMFRVVLDIMADMPPGTDGPYPIRIFAVFEMIRQYHVVIRI